MRKFGVGSLLAVATMAAGLSVGPAGAVTYQFTSTGTAPPGLDVEARIQFADGAGLITGSKTGPGFAGILDFLFRIGGFEMDLDGLLALQGSCANPFSFPCNDSILNYSLAPTVGWIYYNDTGSDFRFEYDGVAAEGFFSSDGLGPVPCHNAPRCTFNGTWTAVAEPGSLSVLLLALGIGARLRRRS